MVASSEQKTRSEKELWKKSIRTPLLGLSSLSATTPTKLSKPLDYVTCARKLGVRKLITILLIQSKALRIFLTNFLLTYNIRAGVSLLLRVFTVIRKDPKSLFSLKTLVDETRWTIREEAIRTGLLVGLFTSIYKAVHFFLGKFNFYRYYLRLQESAEVSAAGNKSGAVSPTNSKLSIAHSKPVLSLNLRNRIKKEKWHSAVAGFLAGVSLLAMDESWHRSLGLYMATRLVQCVYIYNRDNNYFHFWGSSWNHGDSLLFAVSSAQILYAYVMRPETLPKAYHRFIVTQGPVDDLVLKNVLSSCRGRPVAVEALLNYAIERADGNDGIIRGMLPFFFSVTPEVVRTMDLPLRDARSLLGKLPIREQIELLPGQLLHSYTTNRLLACLNAFMKVAKKIFPVYLSLSLVPAAVLRFNHFVRAPLSVITKAILSSAQSTCFLASFCGLYQAVISVQRYLVERQFLSKIHSLGSTESIASVVPRDSKFIYWLAGFLASGSILFERPSRRGELALYALPRAVDSFVLILNDRKLVFPIPYGELLLFCSSMSGIMFFYENHFDKLSPLVAKLLSRFLNNDIVFKNHERLENFDGFEDQSQSQSEASEQDAQMHSSSSTVTLSGSLLVP